jgi:hypothetical protein
VARVEELQVLLAAAVVEQTSVSREMSRDLSVIPTRADEIVRLATETC